jgi:RecA-family ATPase
VHNASENENGSMHSVMAGLRFFAREGRCAVMVAHHVTRPEEKATAASSRGAGAIHAAARFALVLNALDKTTAKQLKAAGVDTADLLQVEIGKWNNGPKGNPVILRRRTAAVGPFSAPVLELFRPDGEAELEEELAG